MGFRESLAVTAAGALLAAELSSPIREFRASFNLTHAELQIETPDAAVCLFDVSARSVTGASVAEELSKNSGRVAFVSPLFLYQWSSVGGSRHLVTCPVSKTQGTGLRGG